MKNLSSYLKRNPHLRAERNASTGRLTTFRVGGTCEYALYPANTEELVSLVRMLNTAECKYTVLGNGSNVVFCDGHYDGAVVLTECLRAVSIDEASVYAECGATLISLCIGVCDASLTGLEFACGIPGSVGGAIFMNAGAYGGEMKDVVTLVTSYDAATDRIIKRNARECEFDYRTSVFQRNGELILSAQLCLAVGDEKAIREAMNENLEKRREKQPLNYPSAGSAFKRYPGRYTGQLIDEAGLRGCRVGGAQVSQKHCGFIVNRGGATCEDIERLVDIIKEKVRQRESIDIECEIRFIK